MFERRPIHLAAPIARDACTYALAALTVDWHMRFVGAPPGNGVA